MEFPTHLAVSFLDSEFATTTIKVLQLDTILNLFTRNIFGITGSIFTRSHTIERLKLRFESLVLISTSDKLLAQDAPSSQHLQTVAKTFPNKLLINLVLLILITLSATLCYVAINLFRVFRNFCGRSCQQRLRLQAQSLLFD